jgi:hypothetical protein
MKKSGLFLCAFAILFLFAISVSAQMKISAPKPTDVVFKKKGDQGNYDGYVELSWSTNFNAKSSTVKITLKNGKREFTENRPFPNPDPDDADVVIRKKNEADDDTGAVSSNFQTRLKYGGNEFFGPNTDTFMVHITAKDKDGNEAQVDEEIHLNLLKQLFTLKSTSQVAPGDAPRITNVSAQDITTDSMKISAVSANANIFAYAIAVQTDNEADARAVLLGQLGTGTFKVSSEPVACLKNKPCVFQLTKLRDGLPYTVFVQEFEPPAASVRASALSDPLTRNQIGNPLETLSANTGPKVTLITTKPVSIKNEEMTVKAQISRASKLLVKLWEKDTQDGLWKEKAKKEYVLADDYKKANDRDWEEKVPFSLKNGNEYGIQLIAYSSTEGIKEVETKVSDSVWGKNLKLFDNIQLDVTNPALELKPVGNTEPLTLTANVTIGNIGIPFTCPNGQLKCVLDTKAQTFIDQLKVGQGDTDAASSADSTATTVTASMKIKVTATAADGTLRSQDQTFELTFSGPKKDGKKGSMGQKFSNFVKSVFTGNDDKSLDSSQLRDTGFGRFLGMALRLFL